MEVGTQISSLNTPELIWSAIHVIVTATLEGSILDIILINWMHAVQQACSDSIYFGSMEVFN